VRLCSGVNRFQRSCNAGLGTHIRSAQSGGGHLRGGARDQETFAPQGQENIPQLLHELIPQAASFTQVVNQGILGHYVATASHATGVYERFNNFADVSPENPTVFEYLRKEKRRPATDT
jgi:hypothetical protein